jgi:CRP-like cAMP-binding protein
VTRKGPGGEEEFLTQLSVPSFFGETSLIEDTGGKRRATVTAIGNADLLELKYDDLKRTVDEKDLAAILQPWEGEAQQRKQRELEVGYHRVVSHVYEKMLSRRMALFQEINGDDADETIEEDDIEGWVEKQTQLVDELKEVGRTVAEVATDITRELGGEDMQISPLEFARFLPKCALNARRLCVGDEMRFHRVVSHIYDRMETRGISIFVEMNTSDESNPDEQGDGTVEADDLEMWLAQQPHLMHEIIKVGSPAIEVGDLIARQLGGADASISMQEFALKVPKAAKAARAVLKKANVEPISYNYDNRIRDYGY